jgi:hypothetical protein
MRAARLSWPSWIAAPLKMRIPTQGKRRLSATFHDRLCLARLRPGRMAVAWARRRTRSLSGLLRAIFRSRLRSGSAESGDGVGRGA